MSDANHHETPGRRPRRCPDEIGDLVEFMGRLLLLLLVIVGPLVFLLLAVGSHIGTAADQGLAHHGPAWITASASGLAS